MKCLPIRKLVFELKPQDSPLVAGSWQYWEQQSYSYTTTPPQQTPQTHIMDIVEEYTTRTTSANNVQGYINKIIENSTTSLEKKEEDTIQTKNIQTDTVNENPTRNKVILTRGDILKLKKKIYKGQNPSNTRYIVRNNRAPRVRTSRTGSTKKFHLL